MDVRITRIKNGFTVYDSLSCQVEYCKTLDEAIAKLKEIFESEEG